MTFGRRPVPNHLVAARPPVDVRVVVARLEQEGRLHAPDSQFLRELSPDGVIVGLARRHNPSHEHVVHAREHVLGIRAPMNVDLAHRVANDRRDLSMQEVSRPDLAPGRLAEDVVFLVHEVHDLLGGERGRWIVPVVHERDDIQERKEGRGSSVRRGA